MPSNSVACQIVGLRLVDNPVPARGTHTREMANNQIDLSMGRLDMDDDLEIDEPPEELFEPRLAGSPPAPDGPGMMVGNMPAANAGCGGDGGPIVIVVEDDEEPVPVRPRLPPRSAATAALARAHRAAQLAKAKAKVAEEKKVQAEQMLTGVVTLVPGAAKMLGKVGQIVVGRLSKSALLPMHFLYLCRAAFLPPKLNIQVGIKVKRLIVAATRVIRRRQELGLDNMLKASETALNHATEGEGRTVHFSYSHLWDEVNCTFVWNKGHQFRKGRMGVHVQTLVQRGGVCCTLASDRASAAYSFREAWFVLPQKVMGTTAEAMWPSVMASIPKPFDIMDVQRMIALCDSVSSFTMQFVCDKASGNLLMLKTIANFYEQHVLPRTNGQILMWAETCTVHLHHRCKLQVLTLKRHTVRHFSLANLVRLAGVRSSMLSWLETEVPKLVMRRVVQERPADLPGNLLVFVDILYKLSHKHHERKNNKKSLRHGDLTFLVQMLNGNVLGPWEHFCYDAASGQPCCRDLEDCCDKTTRAIVNFFQAEAEPIPAESRWTHTLANFKKSLLRKAAYGVGVRCLPAPGKQKETSGQPPQDPDASAAQGNTDELNQARLAKTNAYFNDPLTFPELAALTLILDVVDTHLLYTMLGDPILQENDRPSKVDVLLDLEEGVLGKCAAGLLNLLDAWLVGGASREPWCVLDMVGGNPRDQRCMRFARSQLLRMNSAFGRRYLTRYGSWPYLLYPLTSKKFDLEAKRSVAQRLLRERREDLDIYSLGVRTLFDSVEKLLSARCEATLASDFRSQALSTDVIERLNAEVTARTPKRGPARSFAASSREAFLRQVAVVHRANGGMDPVGGVGLMQKSPQEVVRMCPLLSPTTPALRDDDQQPVRPLDVPRGAAPPPAGDSFVRIDEGGGGLPGGELALRDDTFGHMIEISRPSSSCLAPTTPGEEVGNKQRQGLSAYMLEMNKTLASARQTKGSSLTVEEVRQVRAEFKAQWGDMGDLSVFHEAYNEWRATPVSREANIAKPYQLMWGGGCPSTPITTDEFWAWHQEFGWPTDAEVFDDMSADFFEGLPMEQEFDTRHLVWGIGRAARNINRASVPSEPQFNLVEVGLLNFLDSLTKPVADSGEVLIIIAGAMLEGGAQVRYSAMITGTCYSPKVFDVTPCEFVDGQECATAEEGLPFDVRIVSRPCRAAPNFQSIGYETADEFILSLVQRLANMVLYKAEYDIVLLEDGTLRWSRVRAVERVGVLWEPGMRRPLLHGRQGQQGLVDPERALKRLRIGNPLEASRAPRGRASGGRGAQRGGRGGRRGGRVRQEQHGAAHDPIDDTRPPVDDPSDGAGDAGEVLDPGNDVRSRAPMGEMDMADDEGGISDDSIMRELCANFCDSDEDGGVHLGRTGVIGDDLPDDVPIPEVHPAMVLEVVDGLASVAVDVGLDEEGAGSASSSGAPVASGSADPLPAAADLPVAPWEGVSDPSQITGYMQLDGRTIGRVQYGKPKNSVTINCYRHPNCRLLIAESRCPPLPVLKQWLLEVEAAPEGATQAMRSELAKQHAAIGRQKWFAPRRPAGATSSTG